MSQKQPLVPNNAPLALTTSHIVGMSRIKCLHEESSSSGSCEQANISSYVRFESWKGNETVLSTAHVGPSAKAKPPGGKVWRKTLWKECAKIKLRKQWWKQMIRGAQLDIFVHFVYMRSKTILNFDINTISFRESPQKLTEAKHPCSSNCEVSIEVRHSPQLKSHMFQMMRRWCLHHTTSCTWSTQSKTKTVQRGPKKLLRLCLTCLSLQPVARSIAVHFCFSSQLVKLLNQTGRQRPRKCARRQY